jgi:putative nucleotidyltransferase with HDIG domain
LSTDASHSLPLDAAALTAALQQTMASPSYRPPTLPGVAMEIMQLASNPDAKFHEVERVLQQDPVMAARVLSIAQSAAYSGRSPTVSLHQATVRLGLKTLRELVLEAALHVKVFRVPGYESVMASLYHHSAATAHVTRAVCRRTLVNAEYAFLCGLLHDVGYVGALLAVVDRREWRRMPIEQLIPVLDSVHVDVSAMLMQLWKLPDAIQKVVAHHHEVELDGRAQQANAAIVIAHHLCWEAGAGLDLTAKAAPSEADPFPMPAGDPHTGIDGNPLAMFEEARRALKMDDASLEAARAEAIEIVAKL